MDINLSKHQQDMEVVNLFLDLPSQSLRECAKTQDQKHYFDELRFGFQVIYAYWYIEIGEKPSDERHQEAQDFIDRTLRDPLDKKIMWAETRFYMKLWELVKVYIIKITKLSDPIELHSKQKPFFEKLIREVADKEFSLCLGYYEDKIKDKESFVKDEILFNELGDKIEKELIEFRKKLSNKQIDIIKEFHGKIDGAEKIPEKIKTINKLSKIIPEMKEINNKIVERARLSKKIDIRKRKYIQDCQGLGDKSFNSENDSWVKFKELLIKVKLNTHPLYKELKEIVLEKERLQKTADSKRESPTWTKRRSYQWIDGERKYGNRSGSYS